MSGRSRGSSYTTLTNNNSPNESNSAWRPQGSPTHSQFVGIENEKPLPPSFWPVSARTKMAPVANPYMRLINYRNNEAEKLLGASKGNYRTFKKRKNRKNRKSRKSRI